MSRFLLMSHIWPPAIDGGSRVIYKMGEYLQSKGHQVSVITTNCRSTDDFTSSSHSQIKFDKDDPNIHRYPVITIFHRPFKLLGRFIPNFKTFSKGPIFSLKSFYLLLTTSLKYKPDYILVGPLPTTMSLYARLIHYLSTHLLHYSPKLIINASFHSTDPDFNTPILIKTLKSADYIWTLSEFETKYFNKKLKIPKSKLILLGNGIDKNFISTSPLPSSSSINHLLFIGSFAAHKGLDTLIEAFQLLPDTYHLSIAGQKTLYFPIIENKINSLPLIFKKRIKIITNFPNRSLSKIIDNSSVLISPSTQESFGLVLIEALARSRPVIAADIPASIEIINKTKAGLIFKQNNPQDLASKILKLPTLITSSLLISSSSYLKNHYTWDKIGEKLCQKLHI